MASDMSHLGAVFATSCPAWGMERVQQAMKDALTVCNLSAPAEFRIPAQAAICCLPVFDEGATRVVETAAPHARAQGDGGAWGAWGAEG